MNKYWLGAVLAFLTSCSSNPTKVDLDTSQRSPAQAKLPVVGYWSKPSELLKTKVDSALQLLQKMDFLYVGSPLIKIMISNESFSKANQFGVCTERSESSCADNYMIGIQDLENVSVEALAGHLLHSGTFQIHVQNRVYFASQKAIGDGQQPIGSPDQFLTTVNKIESAIADGASKKLYVELPEPRGQFFKIENIGTCKAGYTEMMRPSRLYPSFRWVDMCASSAALFKLISTTKTIVTN